MCRQNVRSRAVRARIRIIYMYFPVRFRECEYVYLQRGEWTRYEKEIAGRRARERERGDELMKGEHASGWRKKGPEGLERAAGEAQTLIELGTLAPAYQDNATKLQVPWMPCHKMLDVSQLKVNPNKFNQHAPRPKYSPPALPPRSALIVGGIAINLEASWPACLASLPMAIAAIGANGVHGAGVYNCWDSLVC